MFKKCVIFLWHFLWETSSLTFVLSIWLFDICINNCQSWRFLHKTVNKKHQLWQCAVKNFLTVLSPASAFVLAVLACSLRNVRFDICTTNFDASTFVLTTLCYRIFMTLLLETSTLTFTYTVNLTFWHLYPQLPKLALLTQDSKRNTNFGNCAVSFIASFDIRNSCFDILFKTRQIWLAYLLTFTLSIRNVKFDICTINLTLELSVKNCQFDVLTFCHLSTLGYSPLLQPSSSLLSQQSIFPSHFLLFSKHAVWFPQRKCVSRSHSKTQLLLLKSLHSNNVLADCIFCVTATSFSTRKQKTRVNRFSLQNVDLESGRTFLR